MKKTEENRTIYTEVFKSCLQGLTQAEIAESLPISQPQVSTIIRELCQAKVMIKKGRSEYDQGPTRFIEYFANPSYFLKEKDLSEPTQDLTDFEIEEIKKVYDIGGVLYVKIDDKLTKLPE